LSGGWLEDEVASWQSSGLEVVVSLLEDNEVTDLGLGDEPAVCERVSGSSGSQSLIVVSRHRTRRQPSWSRGS
jgi:hypothetical protein